MKKLSMKLLIALYTILNVYICFKLAHIQFRNQIALFKPFAWHTVFGCVRWLLPNLSRTVINVYLRMMSRIQ